MPNSGRHNARIRPFPRAAAPAAIGSRWRAHRLWERAFELLLALLEADGALVTKDELMSRGWPGIFVAEDNLKMQILKLRRALGDDRDLIRTEFGRGYRFTAAVHATTVGSAWERPLRWRRRPIQRSVRRSPLRRLLRTRHHRNASAEDRAHRDRGDPQRGPHHDDSDSTCRAVWRTPKPAPSAPTASDLTIAPQARHMDTPPPAIDRPPSPCTSCDAARPRSVRGGLCR